MKKISITILTLILCFMQLSATLVNTPCKSNEFFENQEELESLWKVGGKIHFEEESGFDYLGTKQLNTTTRRIIKEITKASSDDCAVNAKIFIKKKNGIIHITHYEETSRPGIGEELHATLLYTKPRGFCNSETLKQNCPYLFASCCTPPMIENVAEIYHSIIKPDWKFQIGEVFLGNKEKGPFCLIAELFFEGKKHIYKDDRAVSAGLHIAFVNYIDKSIFSEDELNQLIQRLNQEFQGKQIKIGKKNGMADLEFGISGYLWRIRAGEVINYKKSL